MPEKAAFFHFYSAFCFILREISGLARARRLEVEGQVLVVAPPEYAILHKLEYYREGGSEKHLRDIRSMLDTSPKAINIAELEQQIAARGLQEAWRQVQIHSDDLV